MVIEGRHVGGRVVVATVVDLDLGGCGRLKAMAWMPRGGWLRVHVARHGLQAALPA